MTRARVVLATIVAVVAFYDLLVLVPATSWLAGVAFRDFGDALPAPTAFAMDVRWYVAVGVVLSHAGATRWVGLRFGAIACLGCVVFSALLTWWWCWALQLPLFAIAPVIK